MNRSDAGTLKSLLSSWSQAELLPQFEDENIDIDELLMMKRHHLAEILCSHKLGTRIRFEYYFERWRREQNKPLLGDTNHQHCILCPRPLLQTTQPSLPPPPTFHAVAPSETIVNHKQLRSRATNTVIVRYANAATNTVDMMIKRQTIDEDATAPPPTTTTSTSTPKSPLMQQAHQLQHTIQTGHLTQPAAHSSQPHTQQAQLSQSYQQPSLSPSMMPVQDGSALQELEKLARQPSLMEENTNMSGNGPSTAANNTCPTSLKSHKVPFPNLNDTEGEPSDYGPLMHIINLSGYKGQTLLEYYQQHRVLTNVHRNLLIKLIVNFFEMNGYHLSLKVSHNLEQQILKLFPGEKLQYYRNEKRGRIYVKFCNMKRYKRGKHTTKRKRAQSMDYDDESCGGGGPVDNNATHGGGGGGDGDNMLAEPVVAVECDDDDDDAAVDYAQSFEDWHALQSPGRPRVKTESLSDDDF
ncbi:uncharacterized protein [Eurosta solidaginis]